MSDEEKIQIAALGLLGLFSRKPKSSESREAEREAEREAREEAERERKEQEAREAREAREELEAEREEAERQEAKRLREEAERERKEQEEQEEAARQEAERKEQEEAERQREEEERLEAERLKAERERKEEALKAREEAKRKYDDDDAADSGTGGDVDDFDDFRSSESESLLPVPPRVVNQADSTGPDTDPGALVGDSSYIEQGGIIYAADGKPFKNITDAIKVIRAEFPENEKGRVFKTNKGVWRVKNNNPGKRAYEKVPETSQDERSITQLLPRLRF